MFSLLKKPLRIAGDAYLRFRLRQEFAAQQADVRGPNERPLEYTFALSALSLSRYRDVLDIGPGLSPWPAVVNTCGYHVTAIDEVDSYWRGAMINRHFHVLRDDITKPALKQQFGIVTCISTLEHIPDTDAAIRGMAKLLKFGGLLILTVPYNEHRAVENVYALPGAGYGQDAKYICKVFSRACVDRWTRDTGLRIMRQEYFRCFTGELWTFGERLRPMEMSAVDQPHHLTGIAFMQFAPPPELAELFPARR